MNFDRLIARVRGMLIAPRQEWGVISTESTAPADLYKQYVLILAAVPAVFGFIKGSILGVDVPLVGNFRVGFGAGLVGMVIGYGLALVQVYVVALIVDALAPTFAGTKNLNRALMLAAYAFTAAWVAGVAQILPWLGGLLALAGGLYSIYLLYLGLPAMMRCPEDKALPYTAVSVVAAIIISVVISAVVGVVTGGSGPAGLTGADIELEEDSPMGRLEEWSKRVEEASEKLESAQQSGDSAAQSEAMNEMFGAVLGGDKVQTLRPEQLLAFAPETLDSLARADVSAQRQGAMGMQFSEARATYGDGGDRALTLEITDMGSARGLLALAGFASIESEERTDSGFSKTYEDGGRLVYESWENQGRGEYGIVLGGRFMVKLSGNAQRLDDLKAALNEVDLEGLEVLKDTGVAEG